MKGVGMRAYQKIFLSLCIVIVFSCQTKQDGAVEGTIVPPGTPARITAAQDNKDIATIPAGGQDGKFKLTLAAGTYSIKVTAPDSPYPLILNNIIVKSGESTILPPLELAPSAGKATLSGKVTPPRPDSEVKLIYEGKERAAVHTDSEGRYEFKEVPIGTYVLRAHAPGHAEDAAQVVVTESRNTIEQNAVLIPITPIDGIDWAGGKIRATGIGLPPQNAANDSIRRAMTQRAAMADAQRTMLKTIEQIRIDDKLDVKTAMRGKNFALKIHGFLKGYTVVSERELADGKIEVVLELPLSGPAGLSRYITE